ncbi:MAG: LysM peptidoglycan-binding domain-containing protein [Lapillicoccus sp.]
MTGSVPRILRSSAAAAAVLLLGGGGLRLFWMAATASLDSARASGPDAPADLLVLGASAVGAALLAWLGLGVALALLAAMPGAVGRVAAVAAERVAPAAMRRVTAVVLGTTLATAATPAAHAEGPLPARTLSTTTSQTAAPPAPDPGFGVTMRPPVPDAAAQPVGPEPIVISAPDPGFGAAVPSAPRTAPTLGPLGPAPHTPASPTGVRTLTVVRGDSLWAIAARHLGPHATTQQVAREWPRWYAANRTVIGRDPNLIRVGQVLTVPTTGAS